MEELRPQAERVRTFTQLRLADSRNGLSRKLNGFEDWGCQRGKIAHRKDRNTAMPQGGTVGSGNTEHIRPVVLAQVNVLGGESAAA